MQYSLSRLKNREYYKEYYDWYLTKNARINGYKVGSTKLKATVLSGFSNEDFICTDVLYRTLYQYHQFIIKFKTTDNTQKQGIFGNVDWVNNTGFSVGITDGKLSYIEATGSTSKSETTTNFTIKNNTWYYLRVSCDGGYFIIEIDTKKDFSTSQELVNKNGYYTNTKSYNLGLGKTGDYYLIGEIDLFESLMNQRSSGSTAVWKVFWQGLYTETDNQFFYGTPYLLSADDKNVTVACSEANDEAYKIFTTDGFTVSTTEPTSDVELTITFKEKVKVGSFVMRTTSGKALPKTGSVLALDESGNWVELATFSNEEASSGYRIADSILVNSGDFYNSYKIVVTSFLQGENVTYSSYAFGYVRVVNTYTKKYDTQSNAKVSENTRTYDGEYTYKVLSNSENSDIDDFDSYIITTKNTNLRLPTPQYYQNYYDWYLTKYYNSNCRTSDAIIDNLYLVNGEVSKPTYDNNLTDIIFRIKVENNDNYTSIADYFTRDANDNEVSGVDIRITPSLTLQLSFYNTTTSASVSTLTIPTNTWILIKYSLSGAVEVSTDNGSNWVEYINTDITPTISSTGINAYNSVIFYAYEGIQQDLLNCSYSIDDETIHLFTETTETTNFTRYTLQSSNTRTYDGEYTYKVLTQTTVGTPTDYDEKKTANQTYALTIPKTEYIQNLYDWYQTKYCINNGWITSGTGTSLIVKDGVASGFSTTSWINVPTINYIGSSFEFVTRFKSTSIATEQRIFGRTSGYNAILSITSSKLKCWISSNGTSWNVASAKVGTTTLLSDKWYYTKFTWDGSTYKVELADNKEFKNATTEITIDSTLPVHTDWSFIVGNNDGTQLPFVGYIDLKETHINIDGERYWDGIKESTSPIKTANVTVVGRPTLTDDFIVTDLNYSSKYVYINKLFHPESYPWEMMFKFKITTLSNVNSLCGQLSSNYRTPQIEIISSGKLWAGISSNGSSWNVISTKGTNIYETNTDYWLKAEFTGTAYNYYYSTDGVNFTLDLTKESTAIQSQNTASYLRIGTDEGQNYQLKGNIYLQDCYININGERWWDGVVEAYDFTKDSIVSENTRTYDSDYTYKKINSFQLGTLSDYDWKQVI